MSRLRATRFVFEIALATVAIITLRDESPVLFWPIILILGGVLAADLLFRPANDFLRWILETLRIGPVGENIDVVKEFSERPEVLLFAYGSLLSPKSLLRSARKIVLPVEYVPAQECKEKETKALEIFVVSGDGPSVEDLYQQRGRCDAGDSLRTQVQTREHRACADDSGDPGSGPGCR